VPASWRPGSLPKPASGLSPASLKLQPTSDTRCYQRRRTP
jgi:hypothetical protein